ncbi:MAG: hypothetical protein ACYDC1_25775, partial [Limisphaerales bacterium]
MSALSWLKPGPVFVEINPRSLAVLHAGTVREWPLERNRQGALTEACAARLKAELPAALGRQPWHPRIEARCALPAAGVMLQRWDFPQATDDDLQRVIALRIEGELPLPPDELAWGWRRLSASNGSQTVLVAAVKRETVTGYAELLGACGLDPSFTVGALARGPSTATLAREGSRLNFGQEHSECLFTDGTGQLRLRALPWGEETLAREIVVQTGLAPEAAADLAAKWGEPAGAGAGADARVERAIETAMDSLLAWLPVANLGTRLQLTGRLAAVPAFVTALARRLGPVVTCESIEPHPAAPISATLRGLQSSGTTGATLLLRTQAIEVPTAFNQPAPRHWAIVAGLLLLGVIALPYLEALILQPRLAARVAAVKARQGGLSLIDREAGFLRHLKQNQAPYLETLQVLSQTAPP